MSSDQKRHCEKIFVNKTIKKVFAETLEESMVLDLNPNIVMRMGTRMSILFIAIESTYQAKLKKYIRIK